MPRQADAQSVLDDREPARGDGENSNASGVAAPIAGLKPNPFRAIGAAPSDLEFAAILGVGHEARLILAARLTVVPRLKIVISRRSDQHPREPRLAFSRTTHRHHIVAKRISGRPKENRRVALRSNKWADN